jgi:FkbM family methyltransferase
VSNLTIASRRVAATATDIACRTVGRRAVVRAARFVLSRARLDSSNDMAVNGEFALQRWVLRRAPAGELQVADVGANVGLWSRSLVATAAAAGRSGDLKLHAFDPDAHAYEQLSRALDGAPVVLNSVALSDHPGTSQFHVVGPAIGTNSLYQAPGVTVTTQTVPTMTLDSYAAQSGIERLELVKIDTEGHDLTVLRGARTLLAEHRIAVVQFEYNHYWVYARGYLRDAFEFLTEVGYLVGKLTPKGVEYYPGWDAELETFVHGNYIACDPAVAGSIPSVPWWKAPLR